MNKMILIGNLTSEPETKGMQTGKTVCTFGVAVNDRRNENTPMFFRVSVWGKMGESCQTYLTKGKKVFVSGPLAVHTYNKHDGSTGVSLEVVANDVEFLSPKTDLNEGAYIHQERAAIQNETNYTPVETDELPF